MHRHPARLIWSIVLTTAAGCGSFYDSTPTRAGINTRDLVDLSAQAEADRLLNIGSLGEVCSEVKRRQIERAHQLDPSGRDRPPRNVLCLSGGGAYGAFAAGVLLGWTDSGNRPEFDTVTGISTGALIAPMAFLGPRYDAEMKRFYTDIHTEDIYKLRPISGFFSISLADNSPLGEKIERVLSASFVAEIAAEHRKGRRLYVGTTELEGKRFIVWDIGAIACQYGFEGKDLIKRILLGSSAIPGFFPPSPIPVTVDGRQLIEKHGDGGVSRGIFFRPPFTLDENQSIPTTVSLAGTQVWCVVAGKLYADPAPLTPWSLNIAGTSVAAVVYAQTRGDLLYIATSCFLSGMDFHLTSIPEGFDAPQSATEFNPVPMTRMFNEGYRLVRGGNAWRNTPPIAAPGESDRERASTVLVERKIGPDVEARRQGPAGTPGSLPIPALPGSTEK